MKMTASPRTGQRGVALVITLFFVVLISIISVGFLETARSDRAAASTHMERLRAATMAREGIERSVAILRRETTDEPRQTGESEDDYNKRKRNWISQPGALIVPDPAPANQKLLTKQVALSSGAPTVTNPTNPVLAPPNLNIQLLVDQNPPTHLITDREDSATSAVTEMKLRWIYVRENAATGTYDYDTSETPSLTDKAKPIIGRFAYWTDDESSKINYNLAWKRGAANPNPPGHPTRVTLLALPGFNDSTADALHRFITKPDGTTGNKVDYEKLANHFFNSPSHARTVSPAVSEALRANKFEVTHYNHDPDTTFFNEPRIVLTTRPDFAGATFNKSTNQWEGGRPYLDIIKNSLLTNFGKSPSSTTEAAIDAGKLGNIDAAKLGDVIALLANPRYGNASYPGEKPGYLQRSDWPMVSGGGSSFQGKYFGGKVIPLTEFALSIIDYVRSAESSETLAEPIRGIIDVAGKYGTKKPGAFVADFSDSSIRGADDTYKGLTRSLSVTEMGVWFDEKAETAGSKRFKCKFSVEIHLPDAGGIDSIDLTNIDGKRLYLYMYETNTSTSYYVDNASTSHLQGKWFRVDAAGDTTKILGGSAVLKKGEYATAEITLWRSGARPSTAKLRAALVISAEDKDKSVARSDPGTNRLEVCPVGDAGKLGADGDLIYKIDAAGGPENAITSFQVDDPRVNSIAKDWNVSGQLKNSFGKRNTNSTIGQASATVPEQDTDASGKITDAGMRMPYKKGHPNNPSGSVLSPGELGFIHTGIEVSSTAPKGGVPWRTVRLQPNKQPTSVVPDWAFMDLFTVPVTVPPAGAPVFAPHKTSTGGRLNMNAHAEPFSLDRTLPLAAVCQDSGKDSDDPAKTVSASEAAEIARNIYDRTLAGKGKQYGYADGFDSPGEVVEIKGVADRGEASEELVRQIANLITARGGVFNIYTIGQSLKQTSAGKLLVTAEQRQQALVERFLDTRDPLDNTDDVVRIRTVYFRNLTP